MLCVQIAVSHDGQIQYLPVSTEQQMVNPEDLETAAHSTVTGRLSWKTNCTSQYLYLVLHFIDCFIINLLNITPVCFCHNGRGNTVDALENGKHVFLYR